MGGFSTMLLCTAVAGLCIGAGALAARVEKIQPRWLETEFRHSVIAFGGGVLTAAVALVLVPEGSRYVTSPSLSTLLFVLGGVVFFAIERYLGRRERQTPQLMAMLLDFLLAGQSSLGTGARRGGGVRCRYGRAPSRQRLMPDRHARPGETQSCLTENT